MKLHSSFFLIFMNIYNFSEKKKAWCPYVFFTEITEPPPGRIPYKLASMRQWASSMNYVSSFCEYFYRGMASFCAISFICIFYRKSNYLTKFTTLC